MNKPTTLNDLTCGPLGPNIAQSSRQAQQYPRGDGGMASVSTTQHGGMGQATINFGGTATPQTSTDIDMGVPGNSTLGSSPSGHGPRTPGGRSAPGDGGHSTASSRTTSPGRSPDSNQDINHLIDPALLANSQLDVQSNGGPGPDRRQSLSPCSALLASCELDEQMSGVSTSGQGH